MHCRSGLDIKFFTIDLENIAKGTPLGKDPPSHISISSLSPESFFSSPSLARSPHSPVHKADALRLLLVYKFGGFYLDLDYIVLNPLVHYTNIVVGNKPETRTTGRISVTNNAFSFTPGHPVLGLALTQVKRRYDPSCWNCIGPKLITSAVRRHTRARVVQNIPSQADVHFVPLYR